MVASYYRELLNFCSRLLKDRDAAADVVQESYERLIRLERAQVPIAEPRALLYQTARRVIVDQYRRERLRQHDDVDALDEAELPNLPAHLEPDSALASTQALQAYAAAIEALPPRCREAFMLFVFEDLPQREIAERMGTSVSMIEKHIARGRLACRQCEDQLSADGDSGDTHVFRERGR